MKDISHHPLPDSDYPALIQVVGIGLEGAAGLTLAVRQLIEQATLLVGSSRHLSYFPDHPAPRLGLDHLSAAIESIRQVSLQPHQRIVVLTSGDPLFFGLGRLLLAEFPAEQLRFYPHLSAVQLAFSRIKLPWQDARLVSAHGRTLEELSHALQQGVDKIAVLTDADSSPAAIARLLLNLDLPSQYQVWVCENLGGADERVQPWSLEELQSTAFAVLNVVVLLRLAGATPLNLDFLPALGLPDASFISFPDRPGLMTKREVRVLVLGELALRPGQIVWDIGAGTGSVSIEIARLFLSSQVYAIEKTAVGVALIQQNCQRFQVDNVVCIAGSAPAALQGLPRPDRIFLGGSGGQLTRILDECRAILAPTGTIVLALATLEHLSQAWQWLEEQSEFSYRLLQVQLSRSVPISSLTRLAPLNPVTLVTLHRQNSENCK